MRSFLLFCCSLFLPALLLRAAEPEPPIDPVPPRETAQTLVAAFDFLDPDVATDAWTPGPGVELRRDAEGLRVLSAGRDPYFFSPELDDAGTGSFVVRLRARRTTTGFAQIFSSERDLPDFDETRATRFAMAVGGEVRDCDVPIETSSPLRRLRFDLGLDSGEVAIERVEMRRREFAPLKFGVRAVEDGFLTVELKNLSGTPDVATLFVDGNERTERVETPANDSATLRLPFDKSVPFASLELVAKSESTGATTRERFAFFNERALDSADRSAWPTLRSGALDVRFAPDATGAEIILRSTGARAAVLCPLCADPLGSDRELPTIARAARLGPDGVVECELARGGERRGSLRFRLDDDLLTFDVDSQEPIDAPVPRVLGALERAVLPGVEFLERGERSSSGACVAPKERARFAPESLQTTAPFVAIATDRARATLLYDPTEARVLFAAPDFLDGDENAIRANTRLTKGRGFLRVESTGPIEDAILWAVRKIDPPELARPRSAEEQNALYRAAFERSKLRVDDGWNLIAESDVAPSAPVYPTDFLSTIWGLTGALPATPRFDVGGATSRNHASFLLASRGDELQRWLNGEASQIRKKQRADGSWRYSGKYLRGSAVDYSSGDCGNYLRTLAEHWELTGDRASLDSLLRGLAFVDALPVPRGAQTWELSLHSPDIVAAARCAYANVVAFKATGDRAWLDAARRWAVDGLAFVYLWEAPTALEPRPENERVMLYATTPTFATTDWIAPCWIGAPVQWCGLDYARALIALAPFDDSFDWRKIAEGVVACAERMVYPTGDFVGLLPDAFDLAAQERREPNINPCVLSMLRRQLDGRPTGVFVVDVEGRRVVAPYPVRVEGRTVVVDAKKGATYQVWIDGKELRTIESKGRDELTF